MDPDLRHLLTSWARDPSQSLEVIADYLAEAGDPRADKVRPLKLMKNSWDGKNRTTNEYWFIYPLSEMTFEWSDSTLPHMVAERTITISFSGLERRAVEAMLRDHILLILFPEMRTLPMPRGHP